MAELVSVKYKDDDISDIHLISFVGGKTICALEYLTDDNIESIEYIHASINKVTCPYCKQLIQYVKHVR